ncbi:hypothetical protein DM02DRAFT_477908, partial [Periconia macrospinosa]
PSDDIIKLVFPKSNGDTDVLNVHRGTLCKSSSFYRKAMQSEWTKLREQPDVMQLRYEDVAVVKDYIRWLYSNNISITSNEAAYATVEKRAEEAEKVFVWLAESYVYGEQILDIDYKNAVMKAIFETQKKFNWNMGPASVRIVYEGTPSVSPLRRLIAERIARSAYDDSKSDVGWMHFVDDYPREALVDALKMTIQVRDRPKGGFVYDVSPYLEEKE